MIVYICTKCYLPHNPKKREDLRACEECGGYSVNIDDAFVAPIIELWKKGYSTVSCCSGHSARPYSYSNVFFDKGIDLLNLPEGYEKEIYSGKIMICRYFLKNVGKVYPTVHRKLTASSKLTVVERHFQILDSIKSLTEWVLNLPLNENQSVN